MGDAAAVRRLPSGNGRLWAAVAAAVASTGALALAMPEEQSLGKLVRLVTFHGASTWVNMAMFTLIGLAGAVSVVLLARRPSGKRGEGLGARVYRWEAALRWVAMSLWLANTVLGMVSSKLAWGAVNWSEPRMQASFWILIGAAIVVIVDAVVDHWTVSAALDAAFACGFWALLLTSPNLMHPDNPVLNSGWDIKAPFFGMVLAWGLAMTGAAALVRTRIGAGPDEQGG